MPTNGQLLTAAAERAGIPLRTLDDVRRGLAADAKHDPAITAMMARLMLNHGRLTDEARAYVKSFLETEC